MPSIMLERLLSVSQGAARNVQKWPRLCEKSNHHEAVEKFFNFSSRLTVKRDEEWDCASRSRGFVSIFPTGNMTPDFLHSLGHFWTFLAVFCDTESRRSSMIDGILPHISSLGRNQTLNAGLHGHTAEQDAAADGQPATRLVRS